MVVKDPFRITGSTQGVSNIPGLCQLLMSYDRSAYQDLSTESATQLTLQRKSTSYPLNEILVLIKTNKKWAYCQVWQFRNVVRIKCSPILFVLAQDYFVPGSRCVLNGYAP